MNHLRNRKRWTNPTCNFCLQRVKYPQHDKYCPVIIETVLVSIGAKKGYSVNTIRMKRLKLGE